MMVVLVQLGGTVVVVMVIPRAQLEDVREGGEEEQKHLQDQFLRGAISDEERQEPQELYLYQLDHEDHSEESQQQLVLEDFLCKNAEIND